MAGIDFGIVWKPSKNMIQGIIHLFSSSLKESTASSNEKRISCKYNSLVTVFRKIADAILGVTWRMQSSHLNAFSYFERFPVFGSLCDGQAISTPNDGQLAELLENPLIATGMVRVMVRIYNCFEIDFAAINMGFKSRNDLWRMCRVHDHRIL
ncbi:hypothetical protein ACKS0A_02222 [Histoplasma ohiense]